MRTFLLMILFSAGIVRGLTLEEALEAALRDNPSEAIALARLQQAEARYQQSRAAYRPRISLEAGGTHIRYSDTEAAMIPGMPESTEQFNAGVQARWLLYDGGERRGRLGTAEAGEEAARVSQKRAREQLVAAVARSFYAAQNARESVRIAEADEAFNQRQLDEINRRRDAGQAALADSLNFEIRQQQAESARIGAQSELSSVLASLGALMGQEDSAPPPAEEDEHEFAFELTPEEAWALAEDELPSLALSRAARKAAEESLRAVRGQRRPDIALFGGVEARREDDPNFGDGDLGQTAGVVLSYDLWDGDARRQRRRQAEAELREAEEEVREAELNARANLREAFVRLEAAREQVRISERTLELTRRNRDLVEAAHRAGTESLLRLNEAQRDYLNAESRAAQTRLQLRNAEINLGLATGTLTRHLGN
ncbi:MAG: TolC family protein [Verrucomicrobia bacterium]|nr:TolC family protein [Verrucomicrobiota bacterium]MCH8512336.1 TolC family protein [Kiritimatiellia bacterium]